MNDKTKKIVLASMLGALTFIATIIIRVPMPVVGYINLGDCIVLLCGWVLGPVYGALAAGLGSAIADLSAGYISYAPVTFVVKALMAVAAYCIGVKLAKNEKSVVLKLLSAIVAEIIMVCGYFVYESLLGGIAMAAGNILFNSIQGVLGLIVGVVLINIYGRSGIKF